MAIGSIGGIQSGDWGYDLDIPEVTEVAMEEEAKLSTLVILRSLDLRLLLTSLAVNMSRYRAEIHKITFGKIKLLPIFINESYLNTVIVKQIR